MSTEIINRGFDNKNTETVKDVDDLADIHRDLDSARVAGIPVCLCCSSSDNSTGDISGSRVAWI